MLNKEDFDTGKWKQMNVPIIGSEKIKIDGFVFDKKVVSSNPIFSLLLILSSDLTDKQKEVMDKLEITIEDDNGKKFYPRKEEKKDE